MEFKTTIKRRTTQQSTRDSTLTPHTATSSSTPQPFTQRLIAAATVYQKPLVITVATLAVVGAAYFTGNILHHISTSATPQDDQAATNSAPADLPVLQPSTEANEQLNWNRVSPPEKDPVFAYADTIGAVPISVSQQQLPESFTTDTEAQVAELAKSYNATTTLTADTTKFYIGTSAKGPQSVIFTKNNLLIMIKSQQTISDDAWRAYITSLK